VTPQEFIQAYSDAAIAAMNATAVPASITLSQAALESQWGQKAPGNNLFGIKVGVGWTGETQIIETTECGATGNPITDGIHDQVLAIYPVGDPKHSSKCGGKYSYLVNGVFRAYDSPADSYIDHANLLKDTRFEPCFEVVDGDTLTTELHSLDIHIVQPDECSDPLKVAAYHFSCQLQIQGYATATDYALILIEIIRSHNLSQYDSPQA
jgi:flagellum-specific peptidoglycan hydrolase FlgJ